MSVSGRQQDLPLRPRWKAQSGHHDSALETLHWVVLHEPRARPVARMFTFWAKKIA
ncbi:hypothetical protein GOC91_16160 [Sinorhizobium medicae]|nr:hypothetical protein [Sinorhizobium medicae]MDX0685643.1 hypothetical protein [Sinorhizobium medicae]MDX0880134.1 hypothetical protein [Sinorhizobium medicae]MDX0919119.1 hypothetical protein [Sinorhizobium medicae]